MTGPLAPVVILCATAAVCAVVVLATAALTHAAELVRARREARR